MNTDPRMMTASLLSAALGIMPDNSYLKDPVLFQPAKVIIPKKAPNPERLAKANAKRARRAERNGSKL